MRPMFAKLVLSLLPMRTLTAVVGWAARQSWSKHLIPWYIRRYQIDHSEAELVPSEYECLLDFFARRLREGARTVATTGVVSPVDGTVSACGHIRSGTLVQAKGCEYTLEALLGGADWAEIYRNGYYMTIYLSPRDYHRIHAPLPGIITRWRYIPGSLYPVNAAGVRHIPGLFTKNERLITQVESPFGRYAVVKVGATIVGSIRTEYGPEYLRPHRRRRLSVVDGTVEIPIERGDEIGRFEFGSTVVLLFEPGMIQNICVHKGEVVQMGQCVAHLAAAADPGKDREA
jgi:phosphatidylserine decarboxylase